MASTLHLNPGKTAYSDDLNRVGLRLHTFAHNVGVDPSRGTSSVQKRDNPTDASPNTKFKFPQLI